MPKILRICKEHTRGSGEAQNFHFGYCTKSRKYFVSRFNVIFVGATSPMVLCMYKVDFKYFSIPYLCCFLAGHLISFDCNGWL